MSTRIRHIRIPEDVCEKIYKYMEKENSKNFSQAVISIIEEYFKKRKRND